MKKTLNTLFGIVCAIAMLTGVQAQTQEDAFPNEVDTHIGKLTFDLGVPTEETSKKLIHP